MVNTKNNQNNTNSMFHKHLKRNLAIICFIGLFIMYFSYGFGGWGLDQQKLDEKIIFHSTHYGFYDSSFIYGVNRPWPKIPTLKLIQDVLLFFIPVLLFFIIALKKFVINSWPVAVVSSVISYRTNSSILMFSSSLRYF
jgi:hypothetical protein